MSDHGELHTPPRDTQASEVVESKSQKEKTRSTKKRSLVMRDQVRKPTRRNISSDYDKIKEDMFNKVEDDGDDDDTLPLECAICNKPFLDPVVTKCQHYFCETCALKHEKENDKCCFVCNEPTLGVFDTAVEVKIKIAQQREEAKEMMKEVSTNVEKASELVDDAAGLADRGVKLVEGVQTLLGNVMEMASRAGKIAANAAEMVQEANDTMETVKADMETVKAVMKTVVWDVSVD